MTYDWNKQVEITVPTGTNGWIYSGEVIINGVKVRFPVGVPTTVPEPAAALLNKMIELEREDENNTAKPDNHYVGSVTIPEGKTLTLAKGAKVVDEDGLLGSTPAPVVILPETELTVEEDLFSLTTPWTVAPVVGGVYIVTYNGTVYECEALDAAEMAGVPGSTIMGRTSLANISGGNEDAPFVIMAYPNDSEAGAAGVYGEFGTADGATSVTLSIVEAAKTESAGGAFVVTFTSGGSGSGSSTGFTYDDVTCDKNGDDIIAAHEAGIPIVGRFTYSAVEYVLHLVSVNGVMLDFASVVTSFNDMGGVFNDTISIMLIRMSGTNVTCAQHKKIL